MVGGTRSYEFARRLAQRGHRVHMVAGDQSTGGRARTEEVAGFRVTWLPVPYDNSMGAHARIRAFASFAVRAGLVARQLRADIVLATSTPLTIVLPAVFAVLGRRTPMVFEVRDLWPELPLAMGHLRSPAARWAAFALQRLAYSSAAHVIALSPGMKDGVIARGVPPGAVSVIPNACDRSAFSGREEEGRRFRSQLPWLGDRPLIVYVGTYGRINDVGALVDVAVASRHAQQDLRFLTVGSGAEEGRVAERARANGVLNENFFMLPARPKEEVAEILAAADLTLSLFKPLAEMEANSANKFFDGLAAGRPVAINYGGWQDDLLRESGAGLRLARDPGAAALQLAKALHDHRWVASARSAAQELAEGRFDRDMLFDTFEELLLDVHARGDR